MNFWLGTQRLAALGRYPHPRGIKYLKIDVTQLWFGESDAISNAIGYAMHRSRSHDAVIRVYDDAGNVIETHEHKGNFKEW